MTNENWLLDQQILTFWLLDEQIILLRFSIISAAILPCNFSKRNLRHNYTFHLITAVYFKLLKPITATLLQITYHSKVMSLQTIAILLKTKMKINYKLNQISMKTFSGFTYCKQYNKYYNIANNNYYKSQQVLEGTAFYYKITSRQI